MTTKEAFLESKEEMIGEKGEGEGEGVGAGESIPVFKNEENEDVNTE
jgi:hypothetical protein